MAILQSSFPYDPLERRPLPGIAPLDPDKWLWIDGAYTGQIGEKKRLLEKRRSEVLMQDSVANDACEELLEVVLAHLLRDHSGFSREGSQITCPDDRVVSAQGAPLEVLSQLVQEDFCVLQKLPGQEEHILTAGLLAFPASWRLSDKFMQPLTLIHVPVDSYDVNIARRVQRLFDGIQAGRPLWRYNALWYQDATLHQPRSAGETRPFCDSGASYLRSERQTLLRLPQTQAVVFGIHTFVVAQDAMASAKDH